MKRLLVYLLLLIASTCQAQEQLAWMGPIMAGGGVAAPTGGTSIFSATFDASTNYYDEFSAHGDVATQLSLASGASCRGGSGKCLSYAFSATTDAYVAKTMATDIVEGYVDTWFNLNDVTAVAADSGNNQTILGVWDKAMAKQVLECRLSTTTGGNFNSVKCLILNNAQGTGGTLTATIASPATDTWYCARVYWKRDATNTVAKLWASTTCGGGTAAELGAGVATDTINGMGKYAWLDYYGTTEWTTTNSTVILVDDVIVYSGTAP